MPDKTLICKADQHNKYWSYEINGLTVLVKWGRIGGQQESQTKTFPDTYERDKFIAQKMREKVKKGYQEVDQTTMEKEVEVAKILGHQYKVARIEYVDKKGDQLRVINQYDPNKGIYAEVLNSWSKDVTRLYLTKTESYEIVGFAELKGSRVLAFDQLVSPDRSFVKGVREYLKRLAVKVAEVVTQKFAALGVRALGDEMPTNVPDIELAVNEPGASGQVVSKFAALGMRALDL